jgi:hypothetical protein
MEPWQSWGLALAIGGGMAYYYSKDKQPKELARRLSSVSEPQQTTTAKRRQEKAAPREKTVAAKVVEKASDAANVVAEASSTAVASAQQVVTNTKKKAKAGKTSGQQKEQSSAKAAPQKPAAQQSQAPAVEEDDDDDEDMDTKEWARQLEARKTGVSLSAPSSNTQATRTRKTNARENGATAGDVSDMLEPSAPGPSVMRITGEQKEKKQNAPRVEAAQETKKQRQNRRKVEEARIAREEDERVRQGLLEKQRKAAREARGEPAKNGLAATTAPASSAWSESNKPSTQVSNGAVAQSQPLLDTFDQDAASTASSNDAATNVTTPATVASAAADLPSEETQLEMLNEMNGWNEVSTSKKGKKKGTATESTATEQPAAPVAKENKNSTYSAVSTSELVKGPAPSKPAAARSAPSTNGYAALETRERVHPEDDEW